VRFTWVDSHLPLALLTTNDYSILSFLSLSFLFALPLVAVPVIIHLYRGRQRDVIPWGAMQFLTQATTKGRSMQRLEELLLMLLRVAAILALILALARPMVRSTWIGGGADREVVLLLDNSLSMARTVENSSACDQMIEEARALIGDLSGSDQVQLMLAAGGGQWLTAEGIPANAPGKRQLLALLEEVEPTLGRANFLECLQLATNLEPHGHPASRHMIVLTDNQAQSWQLEAEGGWRQLRAAREKSAIPTTIEVIACEVASSQLENLAVMQLEASRQIVRPGEPVEFTARVANVGETASVGTVVEWLIDEKVFGSSDLVSLAAQESTQISIQLRQKEGGNFAVTCRIKSEDQIALDQQASVVIEVSDQLPILVVYEAENEPSSKPTDTLFAAALGYEGKIPQPWHSVYRPEIISADALLNTTLGNYRAIVFLNLSDLPPGSEDRLQNFVRSGGGLWVALGDQIDRDTFNRYWYDDGDGLSPISLEALISVGNINKGKINQGDTNKPEGSIHPPERDHPATAQLANTTQLDIDQARLTDYWRLARNTDTQRETWVLLEAGDGSPLVVENIVGEGRVLVQAFPLGLEWSNLPQLKSYVVMIHDWLDYLTAPAMARYNLEPGNPIVALVPADSQFATAKLITPAGNEIALAISSNDENSQVRYSQTQLPGLYRITFETDAAKDLSLPFYVARDPSESEWQPLAAGDRSRLTDLAEVLFDAEGTATAIGTTESGPRNEPVWGALLLTLVLLLAGEQLFSNWLARQRSGVAVTTS